MPIHAVVFDAVGTLIDAVPGVADVYWQVGRRHGSRLTLSNVRSRLSTGMARIAESNRWSTSEQDEFRRWEGIVRSVFNDVPDTQLIFAELWQHFAEPTSWRIHNDVQEVWQNLNNSGIAIAVGSNFDQRLVPICRALSPLNQGARLFWSASIGYRKPGPKFYQHIAQQLGYPPQCLLMVGDDPRNDYAGPIRAGWQGTVDQPTAEAPSRCPSRTRDWSTLRNREPA